MYDINDIIILFTIRIYRPTRFDSFHNWLCHDVIEQTSMDLFDYTRAN